MSQQPRAGQPRKSSIHEIKSSWQTKEKSVYIEEVEAYDSDSDAKPQKHTMVHFRRYPRRRIYLSLVLLIAAGLAYFRYKPMDEAARLTKSVMDGPEGRYIAHAQPEFAGMVLVQTLDPSLLPTSRGRIERQGRLLIVGDVHGMKNELVRLLAKLGFDKDRDHLILAGDMISKGPDSRGTLDLIIELGATAVRGNHEDRVLLAYAGLHSAHIQLDIDPLTDDPELRDQKLADMESFSHKGEYRDRLLAKQLSDKHIEWLKKCPVILKVGYIEGMGQLLVVHAGLVPGLDLQAQDPYFVMNMRTIDLKTHIPSDSRDGTEWTKLWNHYQERLEPRQRSTVVYGHDSKRGLMIKEYSKGLDTGCLKGGQLTALVIEASHSGVKQELVQIECTDGRPK